MAKWEFVNHTYANIQRLRQIINVFIKYGFGFLIEQMELDSYVSVGKRILLIKENKEDVEKPSSPVQAVKAFEELGPTFIKLGQILSTRKDLLPPEFTREFEKLKDRVSPFPTEQVYKTIELEHGKTVDVLFDKFEETPSAASSISQVHYARLKSGEDVAVKVQRPGIEKSIRTDIRILYLIAGHMKKRLTKEDLFDPLEVVKEFDQILTKELDFNQEATHIERFTDDFQDDETVCFPKVYWELTSQRVLVMERIFGDSFKDWDAIDAKGLDRKTIANNFLNVSLNQFFHHGFFHADPHSSNIFVQEDGRLGIVDCGMVGQIDKHVMEVFFEVFSGFLTLDPDKIIDGYISIGVIAEDVNIDQFTADVTTIAQRYFRENIHQIKVNEFLDDVIRVGTRHRMKFPSYFFVISKALILVEATVRKIYPSFDFPEAAQEYVKNIVAERLTPQFLLDSTAKGFGDLFRSMRSFPVQLNRVMRRLEKGHFGVKLDMSEFDEFRHDLYRITNRLFFGFVITGIIIGSSIIIQSDMGFRMFGVPIFGVFGYVLANVISLWVLYTIYRSGLW